MRFYETLLTISAVEAAYARGTLKPAPELHLHNQPKVESPTGTPGRGFFNA